MHRLHVYVVCVSCMWYVLWVYVLLNFTILRLSFEEKGEGGTCPPPRLRVNIDNYYYSTQLTPLFHTHSCSQFSLVCLLQEI